MAETKLLIDSLKRKLRLQGKSYLDIANALNLSESSIKRMFSDQNISLRRLDSICEFLEIEISDLVNTMQSGIQLISSLTLEQEKILVSDDCLLFIALSALNHMTVEEILSITIIGERTVMHKLRSLQRIGLLKILKDGKIKMLINRDFNWLPNGPIQTFFRNRIMSDFMASDFSTDCEKLSVVVGMISDNSNILLQNKIDKLVSEFVETDFRDIELPVSRTRGTMLLVALRPWEPQEFKRFKQ